MNFFEHQERAQQRTWWLFALLFIAVIGVVFAVYIAVVFGLYAAQILPVDSFSGNLNLHYFWQTQRFLWVTTFTLSVLIAGSCYKTYQLKQTGGAGVAEQLGGKRLPTHVKNPLHKRLLNIVEEMAIASGLPVPSVYLLDQSGINAFAAGFTPSDTIIGVTQGAIDLLNRDELQGVIAHEFSHILHGDTRINMRMIALLHGMTMLSDIGMLLLTSRRTTHFSQRQKATHPGLLVLGILVFFVGLLGLLAADLIKRAVSRQREFLADASAVQFTRNPEAVANALKTIGGYRDGSRVNHHYASSLSYFFFAYDAKQDRRTQVYKNWWATHPPLIERIHRIEPSFRGQFNAFDAQKKQERVRVEADIGVAYAMPKTSQPAINQATVMASIGSMQADCLDHAEYTLAHIPSRLKHFVHDPYTARAVCYGLLISSQRDIHQKQWALLEKKADPNVLREMLDIQTDLNVLPSMLRLPLLEMMIPALKTLSQAQYQGFVQNIQILIQADHQVSIFEFALHRMLLRHLKPTFSASNTPPVCRYKHLNDVRVSCTCILAMLICYGEHRHPKTLLTHITDDLLEEAMPWPPARLLHVQSLNKALNQLLECSPSVKKSILEACVTVIFDDGVLQEKEMEALRAIADGMDCPMPPMLACSGIA
ncbi:MAG: M48 family metalloprotease [Mariprofundaceae bacterium]|nr:M48 family metalloprotease [Mariprofundaceae bacterium]